MTYRVEALGSNNTTRPALVVMPTRRAFLAGALASVPLFALAPRPHAFADTPADAAGYLTLSGVSGVDEGVAFSSLEDALAAASACESPMDGLAVLVHGTVALGASAVEPSSLADGAAFALVAAEPGACLVVGPGCVLANGSGSLILSGLTCSGALSLSSRDNLAVDSCSFDAGVACAAGGDVSVAANTFAGDGSGDAVAVVLSSAASALTFTSNEVSGYVCAAAVSCPGGAEAGALVVTANHVATTPSAGSSWDDSCVVRLDGGPWATSSIVRNGNDVVSAGALCQLASGFSMRASDGAVQSVASDDITAQSIVSLFEFTGVGSSTIPDATVGVAMDPIYAESASFSQVAEANEMILPGHSPVSGSLDPAGTQSDAADAMVSCIVSYDANGATGGEAPTPVEFGAGTSATVAGMGTLVRAGYLFTGWNTQADGSGVFFAAGQIVAPVDDIVLYAQWVATGTVATVFVAQAEGDA